MAEKLEDVPIQKWLSLRTSKDAELQKREGIEDNSKIIFLISQRKHML